VVIGGASLSGGAGSILGSLIGALIMALLRNGADQAFRVADLQPGIRHRRGHRPRRGFWTSGARPGAAGDCKRLEVFNSAAGKSQFSQRFPA
jgi:ABC-type branched-subunit amino acid transport system permease subunit